MRNWRAYTPYRSCYVAVENCYHVGSYWAGGATYAYFSRESRNFIFIYKLPNFLTLATITDVCTILYAPNQTMWPMDCMIVTCTLGVMKFL